MIKAIIIVIFITSLCSFSQENVITGASSPVPVETSEIVDDGIRVSILGYHDLSDKQPPTEMRIETSKFRKQMETIRQLGIKVISMEQFTAWKKEGREIPKKSLLITLDDGWKSVYTDAYPILKEFGYPFTIYLYKNYVDGGGRALTTPMIKEMLDHGATIGSHSVSHPFPVTVKNYRKKTVDIYDTYLRKELGESKRFLESKFPKKINSYAYPGGFHTEEMIKLGEEFGYDYMFTVVPGKIKRSSINSTLPRYIILGNHDSIFELATAFPEDQLAAASNPEIPQITLYPVIPAAGAIINSRLPMISADLTTLENFNPTTLSMRISGFGEVAATYSAETKMFAWQVNRRLRQPIYQVVIDWKDLSGKPTDTPLRWSFRVDRDSAYLIDKQ